MNELRLRQLYLQEKLSYKKIANKEGVTVGRVQYWMEKYNIPRRAQKTINYLDGQVFGNLTVIKHSHTNNGQSYSLCQCVCGKTKTIANCSLLGGLVKTCGCLRKKLNAIHYKDWEGKRFDRCVVIKQLPSVNNQTLFLCKCDCGNLFEKTRFYLQTRKNMHCGNHHNRADHSKKSKFEPYEDIKSEYMKTYKYNADGRRLSFNLTAQQIWDLYLKQDRKCALSGVPISFKKDPIHGKTASLDRIDSSKGYELDNVQLVHKKVNLAKWDTPENEFFEMIKNIYHYKNLGENQNVILT